MGWSTATEIFDNVTEEIISGCQANKIDPTYGMRIVENLCESLQRMDWDTECESDYWEHPLVGRILGNDFEEK